MEREVDLKIRYLILGLILVLLVPFTSCVYFSLGPSPTPVPTATPSPIDPNFTPPPMADNRILPAVPDFVDAIASVRPSVVAINTTVPAIDVFGGTLNEQGAGSGWIIDSSGLIVTNNHVVEGASSITITLDDGRNFPAELVRADSVSDLAVIKIDAPNLKAAEVGDSTKLRVGDWVPAIGNSLGQGISATKGIVSALGVSISVGSGESLYNLIQTDAAINPGNSGGPLVNLLGEIVGITSIKVAQLGVEGMGYAISTEEAQPIITDLVKVGYTVRPWIGISLYTVDQIVVLRYNLAVSQGALVTQVISGSPADKAGIHAGDVVTAVNGKDIASIDDFNNIIHGYQIGQQVSLTYYRGNAENTVSVTLAASPPPSSP
jgi:serine protease Do